MRLSSPRLGFLSAVLGLAIAPLAQAIPATVNFTAQMTGSSNDLFPAGTGAGFVSSGSFTYEDSIVDSESDLSIGRYVNALTSFTFNIGVLVIVNNGPANITIVNDQPTGGGNFRDRILMSFFATDSTPAAGFFPQAVQIDMGTFPSASPTAVTSTDLPAAGAAWPNLASLTGFTLGGSVAASDMAISFGHVGGSTPTIGFNFLSFTPVQPPPTASVPDTASVAGLLALTLGAMAAGARRLRRV